MTRIELVSSGVIDLYDDLPVNQTFTIYEIEDPSTRTGSWSKTITLPGTSNNNDLFKHIYEVDSYCNFNPLVKAKVVVYSDGIAFMYGYMLMSNIVKNDGFIEYEVNIFSNTSSFFFDMGEKLMQDLDISQYNEIWSAANVEASWTAPVGEGIVYPMIDYGWNLGAGWKTQNLRPAVYVKTYIDAIFSENGYTYTSPFFNSDEFKRLIIPFAGGEMKLDSQQVQNIIIRSYVTTSQNFTKKNASVYAGNPFTNVIQFPNETLDGLNQFDTTTGIMTATEDRYLYITVDNMAYSVSNSGAEIQICVKTVSGVFGVLKSISITNSGNTGTQSYPYNAKTGDQIFIRIYNPVANTVTITSGTFATDPLDANLGASDYLDLNKFIPKKIKQKDFFMSIVKMFNLFVDLDKDNTNNLIIEPRNDFYSSGTVVDWSSKVDYNKPITITPLLQKLKSKYTYTYKRDKDWFNTRYQDKYDEAFGTKVWELDNNITTGEQTTEVIFSNTPLLFHNGLVFPDISDTGQGVTSQTANEYNIRILYYGGLVLAGVGWNFNNTSKAYYPYCGHLDRPDYPEKDLSFGVPREVYYNPIQYTNANLFNRFHKYQLEDITDKDARIVTMYLHLKVTDIAQLDFRSIFYADGHYMRLLEINDFEPNNRDTYKCVFMKIRIKDIVHSDSYSYSYTTVDGGILQPFS